jgi:hypothetical protein
MSGTDRVVTPPDPDRLRERLLECAGACLDHIRVVRFGEATAHYTVNEKGYALDISIVVRCNREAEERKA